MILYFYLRGRIRVWKGSNEEERLTRLEESWLRRGADRRPGTAGEQEQSERIATAVQTLLRATATERSR